MSRDVSDWDAFDQDTITLVPNLTGQQTHVMYPKPLILTLTLPLRFKNKKYTNIGTQMSRMQKEGTQMSDTGMRLTRTQLSRMQWFCHWLVIILILQMKKLRLKEN